MHAMPGGPQSHWGVILSRWEILKNPVSAGGSTWVQPFLSRRVLNNFNARPCGSPFPTDASLN